jgi:hypothetical protein
MPDRDTTLQLLRQSAEDLRREIELTPPAAALWRPKEGEWSAHECLAHLRNIEREVFLYRIRRTIEEEQPTLEFFDEATYHREHWRADEPLGDMLADFQQARDEIVRLLEAAPDWTRKGLHATRGPITLAWQADYALGHTWEHLSQAMRVRLARELAA